MNAAAMAAPHFPALTGRVVDDAHILSSDTIASLEQALADYEQGTSNQVVVATVSSLEGDNIEDYGYKLGRAWNIGQKGKDNGVLLIVAPEEHKVRIEVGYGLEAILTDAQSSEIVHGIILPRFQQGKMQQGVVEGTQAILSVLGGKAVAAESQTQNSGWSVGMILLQILFFLFILYLSRRHPFVAGYMLGSTSRFGGSWGNNGGGFSGGGGSFGGGGASGSW